MIEFDPDNYSGRYLSQKIGEIIAELEGRHPSPAPLSPAMRRLAVDTSKPGEWSNAYHEDEAFPVGTVQDFSELAVRIKRERGWELVMRDSPEVQSVHELATTDTRIPDPPPPA